ncbi:MAG: glycogen/starch synthase, partial [Candidatus Limnocylindrales bacterium]
MRVVCIAAECEPWAKTGGLGDVVDALARAVGATGKPDETGAPARVAAARKMPAPQSQIWMGTGAVMAVGKAEPALPGYVEPPVDVFLPKYRGVAVPDGATGRPLAVPDPLARSGTTEVTLVEFEDRGYRVRMIEHPPAFDRDGYYGDDSGDYADNGWRFGL